MSNLVAGANAFKTPPALHLFRRRVLSSSKTMRRNYMERVPSGLSFNYLEKFKCHPSTIRFLSSKNNEPQKKGSKKKSNQPKSTVSQEDKEAAIIEEKTLSWVERVVVEMNLCPFAAKPLADKQLYVTVVRGDDEEEIMKNILAQALVFTEEKLPGTALVVCPELYPDDFEEYLHVANMITDGLLEEYDLTGKVQIVPFHPRFVFGHGSEDEEDIDDNAIGIDKQSTEKMEYWTNRSPYPTFHILQEDDVSRAVKIMKGDTDRVWQRNVHLLQHLEEGMGGEQSDKAIQRQTRIKEYLLSGKEQPEGSIKSIIQEALRETAKEFPTLARPVRTGSDDKKDLNDSSP